MLCLQSRALPICGGGPGRLFENQAQYDEFVARHGRHDLPTEDINTYEGEAYLGIDAGSTTTKMVLITPEGRLLFQHYTSNKGRPLDVISGKLKEIYSLMGDRINIVSSAVTGYGEDFWHVLLEL